MCFIDKDKDKPFSVIFYYFYNYLAIVDNIF